MEKRIIIGLLSIGILLMIIGGVLAKDYILLCLKDGESVDFTPCHPWHESGVYCDSDLCKVCVFIGSGGYYCNADMGKCNAAGLSCSLLGEDSHIDKTPPLVEINSPEQESVHTERRIIINASADENCIFEYSINSERWKRMCSRYSMNCENEISFDEGENLLKIKAIDRANNEGTDEITFFIDSKEPRIYKTEPRRGFADGNFYVEFDEENPENLKLKINYSEGIDDYNVDLINDCIEDRKTECEIQIDVDEYNNQEIEYWFELEDIARNKDVSDKTEIKVDSIAPIINSVDYYIDRRYYVFTVDFTETFPESVEYRDLSDDRAREKDLCRKFENGICEGKVRLRDGNHELQFIVTDEAGNNDTEIVNVFIDTTSPKIYKIEPRRGFADGNFYVKFKEDNPENLTLFYGNESENKNKEINISKNCTYDGRRYYECNTYVDLKEFDGQEIEYWFELEDVVGNKDESRHYDLDVDTTFPVINNPEEFYTNDSQYIYFNISITEENLDEVNLEYDYRERTINRRLCSRLDKEDREDNTGICEKKFRYREDYTNLQLNVLDEAGNIIGVPVILIE